MSDNAAKQHLIAPADAEVSKIPGVKMRVAIGKNVVLRIPGVESSYRARVVGFDPYEYIILSVRLPSKVRASISLGGQIILKYLHKGTVYGFRTYAIDALMKPAPLVFIEYPTTIEKIELRRQARCEVNLDGSLHTHDGDHECLVMNISTTGCKISARAAARDPLAETRVNDTMLVTFSLSADETFKLPLAVRNIKKEKGVITLGTMFLDLNPNEEKAIEVHLEKMMRLTR